MKQINLRSLIVLLAISAISGNFASMPAMAASASGVRGCLVTEGTGDNTDDGVAQALCRTGTAHNFATVDSVNDAINQIQSGQNSTNNRDNDQDNRLNNVEQKNNTQDSRLDNLETKTKNEQNELDNHESRIKNNEKDISGLKDATTAQQKELDNHEGRISTNEKNISDLKDTTTAQQKELDNHEGRISTNEKDISDLRDTTTAQQKELDNHEGRISTNEKDITGLKDTTVDLHKELDDDEGRITKNEHDIANINATTGAISDGAVFYNRNASGRRSGGLTLDDGSGNAVLIGNVAAGMASTDAVNVAQLSEAMSAFGGGAGIDTTGKIIAPQFVVGGKTYSNVADALKATNEIGVQYILDANGKRTNDIVLNGTGLEAVGIHNVADGKAVSDAATVGQLRRANSNSNAYTDEKFNVLSQHVENRFASLSNSITKNRSEARSGISSAMAMAGLRYDERPGKLSVATGFGNFKGSASFTAGLGYTSETGDFRIDTSISHSLGSQGTGINAGASWTLN